MKKFIILIIMLVVALADVTCLQDKCKTEFYNCNRDKTCHDYIADCSWQFVGNLGFEKNQHQRAKDSYEICLKGSRISKAQILQDCRVKNCQGTVIKF
ncbi:unnamed protein product [Paramecium octaurelia]|uniref:Uncharacterized protein n=1 Tax=Paramecium octaurelia TaxID=43137 RepID=A0A8S1X5J1_PAROT|nr:unnamed protein product [Paramecium octaurelia]